MKPLYLKNSQLCSLNDIPVAADYSEFAQDVREMLADSQCHCVNYFAFRTAAGVQLTMCIAKDNNSSIAVLGHVLNGTEVPSLQIEAVDRFEREIAENFGISFTGHRFAKPVRTAPDNYPFYRSDNEEHHEVGVGPIHAGVIEPGHFRFTCEGETILNLEIMLGYQHRGVEQLMLSLPRLDQKALLAENIAGDTAAGHSLAFASVVESLSGFEPTRAMLFARTLALELERIAIHTGDLSAICGDVAYQLGNAVYGRLRTPIINFMQKWCGNRLGKTSVRPFEEPYPFTKELAADLLRTLNAFEKDFNQVSRQVRHYPSVLSRLERTGTVSYDDALAVGAVGMAARASGLCRDIRKSHPYLLYQGTSDTVVKRHGDVYSRTQIRMEEVMNSLAFVRQLVADWPYDDEDTAAGLGQGASAAGLGQVVRPGAGLGQGASATGLGQGAFAAGSGQGASAAGLGQGASAAGLGQGVRPGAGEWQGASAAGLGQGAFAAGLGQGASAAGLGQVVRPGAGEGVRLAPDSDEAFRPAPNPDEAFRPAPDSFVISLVEGWRGEICHTAITGPDGRFALYKIKDPSFHNWRMLELAVRNNEISDFPICNKSFNLSYCGHDL